MDRDQIQRRDFPTGRRGYDPAAVDEHLRRVADEFETRPSLASGTSAQVRAILEAAERSAAELQTRAGEDAAAHVARVRESAAGLMSRLDELEGELNGLLAALRLSGERLAQGIEALHAEAGRIGVPLEAPPPPVDDIPAPAVDEAGARLTALNMALDGSSREETGRYLAEHFGLADPEPLLDDVFARAGR